MKTIDLPSIIRALLITVLLFLIIYCCYVYRNLCTYKSINVVVRNHAVVEYGSANYDLNELIEKVEGEIVSIKSDIDTNIIGAQEVIVEVKKDNIVKDIPIVISVVDSTPPEIQLKEESVTITYGEDYDLTSNIDFIKDSVDGDISYLNDVVEDSNYYYTFEYNSDEIDNVGTHEVIVHAKDKMGNLSTSSFQLEVLEPVKVNNSSINNGYVFNNLAPNAASGDLVSNAYSLIGSPYVAGGNGPSGFDCSGFVQYLYSQVGIGISRSTSTQINDGVAVSYDSAQPGDILLWGYVDGVPTHSALYVGNGQMVHATNPRQGVIASDVAAWTRGSGSHVIAVRRIQ